MSQYDYNKAIDKVDNEHGHKFSIIMDLGIETKRKFRTVWQIDKGTDKPRFVNAYLDRRIK